MSSPRDRIENDELLFDSGILSHGYAPFMRDYDVTFDVAATLPPNVPTRGVGSYIEGRYRYRFTHCPEARLTSVVSAETWRASWAEVFTDHAAWENAGNPEGLVWGVNFADAYPGMSYVRDSASAADWSARLGHTMHEVEIETNMWALRLVFHDLVVTQLMRGDPITGALLPLFG